MNRADFPAMSGELYSILEGNKVILPLTQAKFTFPKNFFLIGIQNNVDRTISELGFALKRRAVRIKFDPHDTEEEVILSEDRAYNYPLQGLVRKMTSNYERKINSPGIITRLINTINDTLKKNININEGSIIPVGPALFMKYIDVKAPNVKEKLKELWYSKLRDYIQDQFTYMDHSSSNQIMLKLRKEYFKVL